MYTELPNVDGTPATRIAALKSARELLKEEPRTSNGAIFGGGSIEPGAVAGVTGLIRLSTYIETGHDYRDTHPEGKRRPIIKHTNVTLVAPPAVDAEDLEHLMSHISDGSFAEFMEEALKQATENSGQHEDEEAHRPVDPQDRPRFS
jgi:hypothetical protein